jgi:hypothetical protein
MSKKFTPLVVGYKTNEAKQYKDDVERKFRLYNEFFAYVQKFIPVDDKEAFKGNLYATFTDTFALKFTNQFPPQLSVRKMFELMEVDTAKIDFYVREIDAIKIDIDLNTGEPLNEPDWNVYTQSDDQNKLFEYLTKTIDAIQLGNDLGIQVYPSNICQAFSGWVAYDWGQNKLIPNVSRILGMERTY